MAEDNQTISVDTNIYQAGSGGYLNDWQSETSSIGSLISRGLMENGRRYQTLSKKGYLMPSDEQMFDSYEAGHLVALVLESDKANPLFRSPIGDRPAHILDLGTGKGNWAIDVADMYPETTVRGVDLFPPPVTWMPPNCVFEVDNALEEWTWQQPFDLVHMRIMIGSFDPSEWNKLYKRIYDNLRPGGWIEQLEACPCIDSDDESIPADSILRSWFPNMKACGTAAGRDVMILDTMADSIRAAGFVEVHEKPYKWPIGAWARDRRFKEAGMINFQHWMGGMEGWSMWLLTLD
ncbi:hypothetical protein N7520_003100 [Penicillium odoratum]|uniref:uncharacterized protein n=1 Tax=Penicillium odoratum TaxID=1167516 RepID=UPI00254753D6|nr:uncharacterized protein N7520_003100 [Penicillium odoratum]KAJ5772571.1 hypothetical protein N7520_003100 [Penicillium odoratum]